MSLFTRFFSNDNKAEENKKESFAEFTFDGKIRINEELVKKIISYLLAILLGGGGGYVAFNRMSPSNVEPSQKSKVPEQPALMGQEKQN